MIRRTIGAWAIALAAGLAPAALGQSLDESLDALARYRFGEPREMLTAVTDRVRDASADPAAAADMAARLAALLGRDETTDDARAFICRQLALIGGASEVPALRALIENERLADAALGALARIDGPEATAALVSAMERGPSVRRVAAINALAARRDANAVRALLGAAGEADDEIELAAIAALGRIGSSEVAYLLPGLGSGSARARSAVCDAMLETADQLRLGHHDADAAALLEIVLQSEDAGDLHRYAALLGLAEAGGAAPVVERTGDGDPAVRRAAWAALAAIAPPETLQAMAGRLVAVANEDERGLAEEAVVRTARRSDDLDGRARLVADRIHEAAPAGRRSVIRVLGRLGGAPAYAIVVAATRDRELRATAVESLAGWPDDTPARDLLHLATVDPEAPEAPVAFAGYVRLAGMQEGRPPKDTVIMHRKALDAAADDTQRRLVLASLGSVGDPDAAALAEEYLDDPALGRDAAMTLLALSERIGPERRDATLAVIRRMLRTVDDEAIRRHAGEVVNRIEGDLDFVTSWLVSGPYAREGVSASALLDEPFAPEVNAEVLNTLWRELRAPSEGTGRFDLAATLGGSNCCAYMQTAIWSENERAARLEIGSDDGVKAWLNDTPVHANNVMRGLTVSQDKVPVTLRAGWNRLVLKITQGGGGWGFACRLRGPLGFALEGIRSDAAAALAHPTAWEGPGADGFVPLFDGETLAGWRQRGGRAVYEVEDGQIVGWTRPGQPNSFLCTEATYGDFVLELEFRVHPELNSGIQIRSESRPDYRDGRVHGYQVEIDPSERAWSAGIYDESRRGWLASLADDPAARAAFRGGAWNRLRVVARGDTFQTFLNGVPAARLVDGMTARGFIGLQVHGVGNRQDAIDVRWRDLRIRVVD